MEECGYNKLLSCEKHTKNKKINVKKVEKEQKTCLKNINII